MKKAIYAVLPAAVLVMGMTAFAAPSGHCADTPCDSWCSYVDADGDGVCDNCTGTGTHCGFVDEDGDGVCDNGDSHCAAFCDEDGDGICDTCENEMCHSQTTTKASGSCHTTRTTGHHGRGHHSSRHHHCR